MTQTEQVSIEATNLTRGKVMEREVLYFTGGLLALPLEGGGLALVPMRGEGEIPGILNLSWPQVNQLASACGSRFVGSNRIIVGSGAARTEFWRAGFSPPAALMHAADSWSAISHQAHFKGDKAYEDLCRNLSLSSLAAGIRLRDVAKEHHDQLRWSLQDGRPDGARFSNVALFDLYLAIHSLVTELCVARDYLARITAVSVGAKDSIDSMARLEDWFQRPANLDAMNHPLSVLLLAAWGTKDQPSWLRKLGDARNQMLHRQPMAANPEAGVLQLMEVSTNHGPICTIRLAPSRSSSQTTSESTDPFLMLLDLYNRMEQLLRAASNVAQYPPEVLHIRAT